MSVRTVTESVVPTGRRFSHRRKENWIGYLFILPSIIGFLTFVVYPLISSIYYSMTRWSGFAESVPKFIGLKNFIYMFNMDPSFWPSLEATGIWVLISVPTGLILGLLLAALLFKPMPGIRVWRTVYYLPVVLPGVAAAVLWKFIFNPQYGLANQLLHLVGLGPGQWLQGQSTAMLSLVIFSLWGVGGTMVMFLAALQSVPVELYEAARVDGATRIRSFWSVTIPLITPILFLQLITGIIGSFQEFVKPAMLTGGGPNFATDFINYNIWNTAFNGQEFGYATALVWVLFVIIAIFVSIIFKFSNTFVYYESDQS